MSTPEQRARQQKPVEYILVLTGEEAESVVAGLETVIRQSVGITRAASVRRDWKSVIAKIKRERNPEPCTDGKCSMYRNFNGGCNLCGAPCL